MRGRVVDHTVQIARKIVAPQRGRRQITRHHDP